MNPTIKWIGTTLTVCLLAGCYTTGLSPREQGANRYSELVYGFCEQQDSTATEPEPIQFPIQLGVAQIGETAPSEELMNELKKHHSLISRVIELPLSGDSENRWNYYQQPQTDNSEQTRQQAKILRVLGQQMGADYILVVGGNIDSHVEASPVQILDLAILPGMIIPSQKIEMSARAGGALINAKTGRLEFLMTTTSQTTSNCPTFYIDQKLEEMAMAQRAVLSNQLADELATRLINAH